MTCFKATHGAAIAILIGLYSGQLAAQTGTWSNLAPLPTSASEFGVAVLDGRLYAAGNFDSFNSDRLMIYDPAADDWSEGPNLPQGTHHAGVTAVDGKLFVIGGTDTEQVVQIYDPVTATWSLGIEMPTARTAPAVAVMDGKIHVMGGSGSINQGDGKTAHEAYDPATDSWETRAPLLQATEHVGGTTIGGRIYVVGGRHFLANLTATQIYDPATDSWSFGSDLPSAASGAAVVGFRNSVYVFGGETLTPRAVAATVQRYDPATDTWTLLDDMPLALHGVPGAAIGDSIYIVGGGQSAGSGVGTRGLMRLKFESVRPPAPSRLKARVLSSRRVRLRWKDNSDNETSFVVQMKSVGTKFKKVASVAANVKRVVISGLEPDTTYTFRIRAKGAGKKSKFSNRVKVTTPS